MLDSRSAKVLVLSSGQALTALVGIVSAAVLARVFSQHDYASYRQALLAYTFAVPFVTLGFDRALYYFLPGEEKRLRGILVENLLWLLGAGALLSLFLLAGGNRLLAMRFHNQELSGLLRLLILYPLFMLPAASLPACLMGRNRSEQVAGFNVGSRLVMLLATVMPCLFWPSPATAIIGIVIGGAITSAAALVLMFRACNIGSWHPTLSGIRKQARFSVPLGLAGLIATVSISLDQVMVAALCPPAAFAVFVNGAMEIPLIGMVTGSVTSVLIVDYARFYKEGRVGEIVALIHRAMVKCALILIPAMAFLLCMAPEMMRLIFGPAYEASAVPFRIYLLLLPMRTLTFGAIFMATGNSRRVLEQSLIPLVGKLILTWHLIKLLGPIGAPVTTVMITYCLTIPFLLFQLDSILHQPVLTLFPWKHLSKIALASFAPTIAVLTLKALLPMNDSIRLAVTFGAYAPLTLVLLGWSGLVNVKQLIGEIRARVASQFAYR